MTIYYGSYGVCCQFKERLLKLPTGLRDQIVTHVEVEVASWPSKLPEGVYRRKRASTIVEHIIRLDGKPDYWRFTVEAETLGSANRLVDDIITGKATPQVSYRREVEPTG